MDVVRTTFQKGGSSWRIVKKDFQVTRAEGVNPCVRNLNQQQLCKSQQYSLHRHRVYPFSVRTPPVQQGIKPCPVPRPNRAIILEKYETRVGVTHGQSHLSVSFSVYQPVADPSGKPRSRNRHGYRVYYFSEGRIITAHRKIIPCHQGGWSR
jgi:hypothetical protein